MAELKLATVCRKCSFYEPKTQDCSIGILERFKRVGAEVTQSIDGEGPVIHRVCQYRRTDNSYPDDPNLKIAKLNEEVYIRGCIIVIAEDEDSLVRTARSLSRVTGISRFKIVVAHSQMKASKVQDICEQEISFTDFSCVKCFVFEPERIINEAFKRARNGYIFVVRSSMETDPLMIEKVNHLINLKLERVLHIEPIDDSYHMAVTAALAYKAFRGDIGAAIAEKIRGVQSQGSESFVRTWEDVNELYSN